MRFIRRLSAGAFWLWIGCAAIFAVSLLLPRFKPPMSGCYLRDAMIIYVECADVWGGKIIAGAANLAWFWVGYSWLLIPYGFRDFPLVVGPFAAIWGSSFVLAIGYVIRRLVTFVRNRRYG